MLDKSIIKIIFLCSFITGAIIGIFPLIPALTWSAFLLIMFFTAPFIIIYLRKLDLIKDLPMEQNLFVGALSGFSSFLGFSVVYLPIAFILYLIFKIQAFIWVKVVITNLMFLFLIVILTALMSALFNAFSAFITDYFFQIFSKRR